MTNFNDDPQRMAAEAEALMALIDAELHSADPSHPNHISMPSDEELLAMATSAFRRASAMIEADAATDARISDGLLAQVLATWTAELGLVSSTRAATSVEEGRVWKVRVTDPDIITSALGTDTADPLTLTVTEVPTTGGTTVTVTMPLEDALADNVRIVAVIAYGDRARARIPLHQVDLGEAAAQIGLAELSGTAVLAASDTDPYPVLTLSVLATPA